MIDKAYAKFVSLVVTVAMIFKIDHLLSLGLVVTGIIAAVSFLLSILMDNYSIVDKLWSVTPAFYCTLYSAVSAYYTEQLNLRLVLMSMLTAAWGGRLTFNFWRKGGYALRAEDYRWAILREKIPWILWQPFNLSFICIYQHYLLFLIASPAYFVASQQPSPLDLYDLLIAFVSFLPPSRGRGGRTAVAVSFVEVSK